MKVKENAYAKINLYLDVTSLRSDGFHNIVSVMHAVSLCDDVFVEVLPSDHTEISVTSSDLSLPCDESNLAYKSALKYFAYFDKKAITKIHIEKRIPIGAGLGGGSSDAAAVLRALNKILGFATKEQLLEIAEDLGSDVPFCLIGGCALCKGRGEKISDYKAELDKDIVIAIGESRVSTPKAYSMLDAKYGDFKLHVQESKDFDVKHIPVYNIFESVIGLDDVIRIKKILFDNMAEKALMSGSGPSVFGIFKSSVDASKARSELENAGFTAFQCRLV